MKSDNKHYTIYFVGIGVLVLLLVGSSLYVAAHRKVNTTDTVTQQVSSTPTVSPTGASVAPVTASPTASSSAAASASATASASGNTVALPDSAKAFLANFYQAYSDRDSARLAQYFSTDPNNDLATQHSELFTGHDLQGRTTGTMLFNSTIVSERATSYVILGAAPQLPDWIVTVKEQRALDDGTVVPNVTTLMTLVPAPNGTGTWLIDAYIHANSTGKYNGFFSQ